MGVQTFFRLTTCLAKLLESIGILAYNDFKYLSVSDTLSLEEETNTPVTPKVLGLNLTIPVFGFKREKVSFKKLSA